MALLVVNAAASFPTVEANKPQSIATTAILHHLVLLHQVDTHSQSTGWLYLPHATNHATLTPVSLKAFIKLKVHAPRIPNALNGEAVTVVEELTLALTRP